MRIVFAGENPKRELADCWSVEVVNGGEGARETSDSLTSSTDQEPAFAFLTMSFTSRSSFGSLEQVSVMGVLSGHVAFAVMTQKFSGMKLLISRSFSTKMRSAGDWTRPAERP